MKDIAAFGHEKTNPIYRGVALSEDGFIAGLVSSNLQRRWKPQAKPDSHPIFHYH
ncbi:MAG: hypothetical protein GY845_15870 [Planctomycetes bacterium]|nr:hypothetical protein [Planctomycetota bacterium]